MGEKKHLWLLGWLVLDLFSVLENECSGQSWSVVPPLGYRRNKSDGFVRGFIVPYCFIFTENKGSGDLGREVFSKDIGVQSELECIGNSGEF